jgi:hypothetical protein
MSAHNPTNPLAKQSPGPIASTNPPKVKPKPKPKASLNIGKSNPFQARARKRLAQVRLSDPGALSGVKQTAHGNFTRADRLAISKALKNLKANHPPKSSPKDKPYDPLASLSGSSFDKEVEANAKLQFGPQEEELKNALQAQDRRTQLEGSSLDQYAAALAAAKDRINQFNGDQTSASQGRVDSAYSQDKAVQEARDKAAQDRMVQLGLAGATPADNSGAQAVEGARSQGNQAVTNVRAQGAADNTLMEKRGATAVLQKAEAGSRNADRRSQLESKGRELAAERGAFSVSERGKLRDAERQYAAVKKEFGLKEADLNLKKSQAKSDASIERYKVNGQKLIAKLYADANQAKARATIRVAQLQLKKGKIDQHTYATVHNIYSGLPKKGKSPQPKGASSGGGTQLQTWEQDKVGKAVNSLGKHHVQPSQREQYIQKMIDGGLSPRLARIAWQRYVSSGGAGVYNKPNG